MNGILNFFMSKDGLVAVAGLILLGVVSHYNTENPWVNFVARSTNLGIFLYILWRAGGQAAVNFFAERRAGIALELDSLEQQKKDARAALQELRARIVDLDAEREAILSESRKQAEAIKAGIIAQAEHDAATIRENAVRSADSQLRTELKALREQVAEELQSAVETALKTQMTPKKHAQLVDKSLKKVVLH